MLGKAQRIFEKRDSGWPIHSLGNRIHEDFFNESIPLTRKMAREIRDILELWIGREKNQ